MPFDRGFQRCAIVHDNIRHLVLIDELVTVPQDVADTCTFRQGMLVYLDFKLSGMARDASEMIFMSLLTPRLKRGSAM